MAYDKIITIRSRLDHCVDYVLNRDKTDMAAVLDYIGQAGKNTLPDGSSILETAINCNLESACQDMQETKRRWGKTGGVLGYHLIHAFAPGEVTPEQAHTIGVEFASRLLGDRYEAVVSTHLDREHLHCHILFNSVYVLAALNVDCLKRNALSFGAMDTGSENPPWQQSPHSSPRR